MKVILVVIDSFGIGELPDADKYGDVGSNTYLNIYKQTGVELKNMINLGLNNIDGVNLSQNAVQGSYARLKEITSAKDTTAGHYEISGIILKEPYPVFPNGFPKGLIDKLSEVAGTEFLGMGVASGTEIIKELGKEHLKTKKPIIYTSADSVLQVATHIDVYSLEQLYDLCEKFREMCKGKYNFGRVIARPFATNEQGEFYRMDERKDYTLEPPELTMLDKLKGAGFDVVAIGKIEDIFCFRGITESYHTRKNADGIAEIIKQTARRDINGLIFANLNDTDMLYGHRNNVEGYAQALLEFDNNLPIIINNMAEDDILIVTADHGCDPTTESTDHSREYVPMLVVGKNLKSNVNLGTIEGFNCISNAILDNFGIEPQNSFLKELKK